MAMFSQLMADLLIMLLLCSDWFVVFPSFALGQPASSICTAGGLCTLWCGATGVPSPSIYWFHDGVPVIDGNQIRITISSFYNETNATLSYDSVSVDQAGEYHCMAANFLVESASTNSSLSSLTVHCKYIFTMS